MDNLELNANAYFYKVKDGSEPNDFFIKDAFKQAREDKEAVSVYQPIIRQEIIDENDNSLAVFSLDISSYETKPNFHKEQEDGVNELKYSLFLIVEYGNYFGILKKHVSGVSVLKDALEAIDFDVLTHFLITSNTRYEKVQSTSIKTVSGSLRKSVSESRNVENQSSQFVLSKRVPISFRIDNDGQKYNIAPNTSRVNAMKVSVEFSECVDWICQTLEHIDEAYQSLPPSPFMDNFAKRINYSQNIDSLKPLNLVLDFSDLLLKLETGRIDKIYTIKTNDDNADDIEIDFDIYQLINDTVVLHDTDQEGDGYTINEFFTINKNKQGLAIDHQDFKSIFIRFDNDNVYNINRYINSGGHFMVNFTNPEYVYLNKKIFKDSRLLGDIESFMKIFKPHSGIVNSTSEKGEGYDSRSVNFDSNSLFAFVENELAQDSNILICDDLGVEWGDFISFKDDTLNFYHVKHKKPSFSASDLQDVFGQVQKNLGFANLSEAMIDYRKHRWLSNYNIDNVQTNIKRIRRNSCLEDPIGEIIETNQKFSINPKAQTRIFIVIDFISRSQLKKNIEELRDGHTFNNKGVTNQILWYVSSLMSNAKDLDIDLEIICRP